MNQNLYSTKASFDLHNTKAAPAPGQSAGTKDRPTEITERMSGVCYEIDELSAYIANLEDRLQAVLAPHPPEAKSQDGDPVSDRTELGASLRNFSQRLYCARERICSLLRRLEV